MQFIDHEAATLLKLTPETARQFWRSPAGAQARQDFDRREKTFMAYISALVARQGSYAAKSAWEAYDLQARVGVVGSR